MTDNAARDLLIDSFARIRELVVDLTDGLSEEDSTYRPAPAANTPGWLLWHLTRVQDDHIAGLAGAQQAWPNWRDRFALPFDVAATGYGFGADDVAATDVTDPQLLVGYHAEVHRRTAEFLRTVTAEDLDRVVDRRWNPPVTLGVRLVSVITDDLQHAGQAGYLRGVLEHR